MMMFERFSVSNDVIARLAGPLFFFIFFPHFSLFLVLQQILGKGTKKVKKIDGRGMQKGIFGGEANSLQFTYRPNIVGWGEDGSAASVSKRYWQLLLLPSSTGIFVPRMLLLVSTKRGSHSSHTGLSVPAT